MRRSAIFAAFFLGAIGLTTVGFGCVGDLPPATTDGGDGGGGGDGGDGAVALLPCGLQGAMPAIPLPRSVVDDAGVLDGGAYPDTIDTERFAYDVLSITQNGRRTGVVIALGPLQGGMTQSTVVWTWSIEVDNGMGSPPLVTALAPVIVPGRVSQIFRSVDGFGLQVWEPKGNVQGFTVYKLTDQDLASRKAAPIPVARLDVTNPMFESPEAAAILALGPSDYFLVADMRGVMGGPHRMITARFSGMAQTVPVETDMGGPISVSHDALVPDANNELHVFLGKGSFPSVMPAEWVFNAVNGQVIRHREPPTLPLAFLMLKHPAGISAVAVEGDWQNMMNPIKGVRVGTIQNLNGDLSALPLIPMGVSDLFLRGGSARLTPIDPVAPMFTLMGAMPTKTPGVRFMWIDSNGVIRAQYSKDLLFAKEPTFANVTATAVLPLSQLGGLTASIAWANRENNDTVDKLYVGLMSCLTP